MSPAPLRGFRVGVVGARRVRDGTGQFLAGFFHAAGCKVVAVAGTSIESAGIASRELSERYGIAAQPFGDARAMIDASQLDAIVIASPDATHEPLLRLALDAGLHTLCEKPLVYGGEPGWAARGEAIVRAFADRGLCLAVNAQMRFALPAYMRLFPDVVPRAAKRFEMLLSPPVGGRAVIASSMPHPLSVTSHLWPVAELETVSLGLRGIDDCAPSEVTIEYALTNPAVACSVAMRVGPERPRPFSFGFDGAIAHRVIRDPGYQMALRTADGSREVPLPDPVEAVVKDFVARVRRGPPFPVDAAAIRALHLLEDVDRAWAASVSE